MRKALVVVDSVDGIDRITREAGELAAGVGAEMVLLHVTSESDYEEDRKAMEGIDAVDGASYDFDQAKEGAREFARDLGKQVLQNIDVEYEVMGAVGEPYEQIMQAAEEYDCDHIFMTGKKRSPSGKAIFGDTAQRVILNFNNPVTILTVE